MQTIDLTACTLQLGVQLGSAMQVLVSEAPDDSGCLLVHALPSSAPIASAQESQTAHRDWRLLTLRLPPSYPASPPAAILDCSWLDTAESSKVSQTVQDNFGVLQSQTPSLPFNILLLVQAATARDFLESAMAAAVVPLKLDRAIMAWRDALAAAEES